MKRHVMQVQVRGVWKLFWAPPPGDLNVRAAVMARMLSANRFEQRGSLRGRGRMSLRPRGLGAFIALHVLAASASPGGI